MLVDPPLLNNPPTLPPPPNPPPLLLHRDRPVRLFDRLDDRLLVERQDAAQVYDLGTYVVLFFKLVGNAQAQVDLPTVGDQGHVVALAGYSRLTERYGVL